MDNVLGVICALASGAGLMFLYLQVSGRLRNYEHEQELWKENKELKEMNRLLSKPAVQEDAKWIPKAVSKEKIDAAVSKSMAAFLAKYAPPNDETPNGKTN